MATHGQQSEIQADINKAIQLRKDGKLDAALAKIQNILEVDPNFVPALNQMGATYLKKKAFQKAASTYERAIELNPTNANFHNALGDAYVNAKHPNKAIKVYQKAIKLNPNLPPNVRKKLGDA